MLDFIVMQMSGVNREKGYGVVTLVKLVDEVPFFSNMKFTVACHEFFVLCSFFVLSDVTQLYTPVQAGMTVPSNLEVQWKLVNTVTNRP